MPRKTFLLWILCLLPLLAPLTAQDSPEEAARKLQKLRELLQNQPAHTGLFDRYFKQVVASNALEAELEKFAAEVEKTPDAEGPALIYGRLLLRADQEQNALEVLEAIPGRTPEVHQALGEIYNRLARFDQAARAFEAALTGARSAEQKSQLFEKIGTAQLKRGARDQALATWRRIGELDGGSFARRLRVAQLMAESGLLAEAAAAYQPLLEESREDPAQHCRVLRDFGRLQELQGELEPALATYDRVLALTDRGNWLRREIELRVVAIHRRTGKLEGLLARLQEQHAAGSNDLAATELLASVLIETRQREQAIEVLAAVAPKHPKDVRLARRLAELQVESGAVDAAIQTYQRILTERPEELELYLELGTLFAKSDRFAEARNQWDKALARNLKDASLCARLASMFATWGHDADAIRLYEQAVELEPESMQRVTELTEFLFGRKQPERAVAVLEAAIARSAGKPRSLEALVGVLRENGLRERAEQVLRDVLALEPGNHEIRFALADLIASAGRLDEALPLLWEVVENDDGGSGHRAAAANMLVAAMFRAGRDEELLAEAGRRGGAGAAYVLGRAHTRTRDFEAAMRAYRSAIEARPDDAESRRLLARLLADSGRFHDALEQYSQLAIAIPGEGRRQFREVARLHLELYDLDAAIEVWERAMRDNPDNAAVFVEVGREFLEIQRVPEALEAFRQAARLKPRDVDIQLRLAHALSQTGQYEEAEKQLLAVAAEAVDPRDRSLARQRLFQLYGEQGVLDERTDALAAAVAENPYEVQSAQLLADLLMRAGDYVRGLDHVERALQTQPHDRELLARQAELLESLEEWERARGVHEALLKQPDADRDTHLSGVARTLFELGRSEEARSWVVQIRDQERAGSLLKRYEMYDEAIAYHERLIAREPSNLRAYTALAEALHQRGRNDQAVTVLERALNLRPFHRPSLELVGKLYVQVGRRDDAVQAGLRLFGMRGEQDEKTREEERAQELAQTRRNTRRNMRWSPAFGQQRLQAAQSYFEERGLSEHWGPILLAEARRRPADLALFTAVQQHFAWRDRSPQKLADFLHELLERDFSKYPIPPEHTPASFREHVETVLVGTWIANAPVAEARLAALGDGNDDAAVLVERAVLLEALGRVADAEAALRRTLELAPAQPIALARLAQRLIDDRRYADAAEQLRRLEAWWADADPAVQQELEARELVQFRRTRKDLLDELPRQVRRRVSDEQLLELSREVDVPSWNLPKSFRHPESLPQPPALREKLVRLQRAAGDETALQQAVADAIAGAKRLGERASLGLVLYQEDCKAKAREVLEQVLADGERLRRDPAQLYFWRRYAGTVARAALPLGELLAAEGEHLQAWSLLRDHGHADKAELVLRESGKAADVQAMLQRAVAAAAERLAAARTAGSGDLRSLELDYRDEVIKLADYHIGEKQIDLAEQVYVSSLALLPDDLDVRRVIAALRIRRGAHDEMIAMREEIIAVERRRRRTEAGETSTPPTRLLPSAPGQNPSSNISSVSYYSSSSGTRYYRSSWRGSRDEFDVSDDYQAILSNLVERKLGSRILEFLRRTQTEDPVAFRDLSWQALDALKNQDLGPAKLPVLRLLRSVVNDEWLTLEYARTCRDEGDLEQARDVIEKLLARTTGTQQWYAQEGEAELEKIRQRLGEPPLTAVLLRAEVERDQANVRKRMRLVERLFKDHSWVEALAEAKIVVDRAPYLERAKEIVVQAAAAVGDEATAIAMQRQLFDEATSPYEKIQRGVGLANWLWAQGNEDEAKELVRSLEERAGGNDQFSPGNWFLDKQLVDDAHALYEKELVRMRANEWRKDQLRSRLARLELARGDTRAAVTRVLEALAEAGSLQQREQRWRELLMVAVQHPEPAVLAEALQQAFGKRETVDDLLVMAAAAFATGDVAAAERDLGRAVEMSPKEVYLYPLLLGLRRLEDDHAGALAVLDRMERVYGGSETRTWSEGASMTQRDQLRLLRASILRAMGKEQQAEELVTSLVDETNAATFQLVSQIYRARGELDKALEWYRKWSAKLATKDRNRILGEANLLLELDREAEAMPLVREAYLMARGDNHSRSLLLQLHRRAGTLAEFVAELEADFRKDKRDSELRSALIGVYTELRKEAELEALHRERLQYEDEVDEALSALQQLAARRGDTATVLDCAEQRLARTGGDARKQSLRSLAELLWQAGRKEDAIARHRESHDLGTAAGLVEHAEWLQSKRLFAQEHAAREQARALDPERKDWFSELARCAWQAGELKLALQHQLRAIEEARGQIWSFYDDMRSLLLDGLAALPPAERDALLDGGDSAAGLERAAVLALARADFAGAETKARAALALEPDRIVAMSVLNSALEPTDRVADRIAVLQKFRERIEREWVTSGDWTYHSLAQKTQDQIGLLHALQGNDAEAEAAWRAPFVRRTPYSNPFGYWRGDWQMRFTSVHWLGVGRPDRALTALQREFLLHEDAPWSTWLRALDRSGQRDRVEAFAWSRLLSPLTLYGVQSDSYDYIWADGEWRVARGTQELLADLYRREGRLDELRAKVDQLVAQPSTRRQAEQLRESALRMAGEPRALAELYEKRLEQRKRPPSAEEHLEGARLWARAGEPERGLEHLREVLDFDSPALRFLARGKGAAGGNRYSSYSYHSVSDDGNPFEFTFSGGGGDSWWYGRWNSEAQVQRIVAAGLLLRTGQREQALEIEADLLAESAPEQRAERLRNIAREYTSLDAPAEAMRVLGGLPDARHGPQQPSTLANDQRLWIETCERAGDEAAARAGRLELRKLLEAAVAEAPGPHAIAPKRELVTLLVRDLEDAAAAGPLLAELQRWCPHDEPLQRLQAVLAILSGDGAEAVAICARLEQRRREHGELNERDEPDFDVDYGRALIAAGRKEEGVAKLVAALPKLDRRGRTAQLATKLLEQAR